MVYAAFIHIHQFSASRLLARDEPLPSARNLINI